ncbi:MAG: FUSC family protein, partial [Saezia sp.]
FVLGGAIAVLTTLLLWMFTYDYPLPRIFFASAIFFVSVYLMRVTKISIVFFLIATVIIYSQSLVTITDQPEILVRMLLWVWVAAIYPIVLALLINTLFLPLEPQEQLKAEMQRQIKAIIVQLQFAQHRPKNVTIQSEQITSTQIEQSALSMQKLLRFTNMRKKMSYKEQANQLACIATLTSLYSAVAQLQSTPLTLLNSESLQDALIWLLDACTQLNTAIQSEQSFDLPPQKKPLNLQQLPGAVRQMHDALQAYADIKYSPPITESNTLKEKFFVADAIKNPVYVQFALKTLLATLLCYFFYSGLDWDGIHTIMLTCIIVAQPSLGATNMRSILRIAGAVLGSALALLMVIFVVPHIDGIVGLLLITLPVLTLGAWISTGSERSSYVGIQLMFTFSLALLSGFGPSSELTEIRDRIIGISLGVGISFFIHSSLWPEVEGGSFCKSLANVLRQTAQLLQTPVRSAQVAATTSALSQHLAQVEFSQQYMQSWVTLASCETSLARVALEPSWQQSTGEHELQNYALQTILAQSREILLAINTFRSELNTQDLPINIFNEAIHIQQQVANALSKYANNLAQDPMRLKAPAPISLEQLFALCATDAADLTAVETQNETSAFNKSLILLLRSTQSLVEKLSSLPSVTAYKTHYNHLHLSEKVSPQ